MSRFDVFICIPFVLIFEGTKNGKESEYGGEAGLQKMHSP